MTGHSKAAYRLFCLLMVLWPWPAAVAQGLHGVPAVAQTSSGVAATWSGDEVRGEMHAAAAGGWVRASALQSPLPLPIPTPAPAEPVLSARLSTTPEVASPGDPLSVSITVTNEATVTARNVVARLSLPVDLALPPESGGELVGSQLVVQLGDLPPGGQASRTWASSLIGLPAGELEVRALVTADDLAIPVVATAALVVPALPAHTVRVPAEGGALDSPDGRVSVVFPAGWSSSPAEVTFQLVEWHPLGQERGVAIGFELHAVAEDSGGPIAAFNQPVTVQVDLNGLLAQDRVPSRNLFLRHRPEASAPWENVALVANRESTVVAGQFLHFSQIQGGASESPALWKLPYNPPSVSTFSGAATYNYPIEIPPGRGGFQPQVNLSYSSRRVDGMLGYLGIDAGPLGVGWSADQIDIVRTDFKPCELITSTCFTDNHFVLTMNGTGYDLIPMGSKYWGRFYAKDAPGLRVERRNYCDANFSAACAGNPGDGSPENESGDYWVVHTGDGTEYRLGYTSNSEQLMGGVFGQGWAYSDGYGGIKPDPQSAVKRWRVDRITDVHDNTMDYGYWEYRYESSDRWSLLQTIEYNLNGARTAHLSKVEFVNDNNTDLLGVGPLFQEIRVWHGGQLLRKYLLDTGTTLITECGITLKWAKLEGVQVWANGQTLPQELFGYVQLPNWYSGCFHYPRLDTVENGYGGRIELAYNGGDGYSEPRQCSIPGWIGECPNVDPKAVGQTYSVLEARLYDGIAASPAWVTYEYGGACRGNLGSPCAGPQAKDFATIVGYGATTERSYERDGRLLSVQAHSFLVDYGRLGREYRTDQQDANNVLLQRVENSWGDGGAKCPLTGLPAGAHFACLEQTTTRLYDGASSEPRTSTVVYQYLPSYQGNKQFGNLTHIHQYLDGVQYRVTRRWFYPNEAAWIVDKQASEGVYDCSYPDCGGEDALLNTTWTYYGNDVWNTPPSDKGAVTRVRQVMPLAIDCQDVPTPPTPPGGEGCAYAHLTVDTEFAYDSFGNLTSTVAYQDYGIQTQAGDWTPLVDVKPTQALTTGVAYDNDQLYPVEVTNTLEQAATTVYDSDFPWLPATVTDPNGAVTGYQYDDFGRLTGVFSPDPQTGQANFEATRYVYYDFEYQTTGKPFYIDQIVAPGASGLELTARTFYDGLGRAIQSQTEKDENLTILSHQQVNALGQLASQSTPMEINAGLAGYLTPAESKDLEVFFSDTFDQLEPGWRVYQNYTTIPYPEPGNPGNQVARLTSDGTNYYGHLWRDERSLEHGDEIQVRFKTDSENPRAYVRVGDGTGQIFGVIVNDDHVYAVVSDELGWRVPTVLVTDLLVNTWYVLSIRLDDALGFVVSVFQQSNPAVNGSYQLPMTPGLPWRFEVFVRNQVNFYVDDYLEQHGGWTVWNHDPLGRVTRVTNPDNTVAGTLYAARTTTGVDANGHVRLSTVDDLGRLVAVDESLTGWRDDFSDGVLTGWQVNEAEGEIVEEGGLVRMTGGGVSYGTHIIHPEVSAPAQDWLQDGEGVLFDLRYSGSTVYSAVFVQTGEWHAASYRRWGFLVDNSGIYLDTYEGTNHPAPVKLMELRKDVWYRVLLKVGGEGEFVAQVWERDNPAVSGQRVSVMGPTWAGADWLFVVQQMSGVFEMDSYEELAFHTTHYQYDERDQLVQVTDALGITTTMTYDALGRKTAMHDPDMGDWAYHYDAAGNLIAQIDARRRATDFYYDELNRLLGKVYQPDLQLDPAGYLRPADPGYGGYDVAYWYDEAGYGAGLGRRTRMADPSGSTSWRYDLRGRMTEEVKTIDGAGTFTTTYGYDLLDRPTTITYPDGEVVTTGYNPQGLPESLTSNQHTALVTGAGYNPLGQMTSLALGNTLTVDYTYFSPQAGNSRLQSILAAGAQPAAPLLDLSYGYDPAGNVVSIGDATNSGQVQTFTYDALDRLIEARSDASGEGVYHRSYQYGLTGNLLGRTDWESGLGTTTSYSYTNPAHVHAVTALSGAESGSFVYDANGNMIVRDEGGVPYQQQFDPDASGRLVAVTNTLTLSATHFVYDGDGNRTVTVHPDGSWTAFVGGHYEVDSVAGGVVSRTIVLQPGSEGYDSYVYSSYPSTNYGNSAYIYAGKVSSSQTYRGLLEFDLASIPADAVVDQATLTLYCRKLSTSSATLYLYRVTKGWGESSVTWNSQPATGSQIEGTLYLSSSSYQAKQVELTALVQAWVEGSQVNQGVMVKEGGSTTYGRCYSSDYGTASQRPRLEIQWHRPAQPATRSYYYFGSQRVAMQVDDGGESKVYYIHTDHLGSTSAMSNESGTLVEGSVTRYLPYGGYRTAPSASLTDRGFTGHKHNDDLGLIYMRARYYVPGLGRFASADTIVPDLADPQNLNRYSYASNNPVRYLDPSGHSVACGTTAGDCGGKPTHPWTLPTVEVVQEIAEAFDIPAELLGAVLETVQEVDYSTMGILSNDKLEDYIFGILSHLAHPVVLHPPLNLSANTQLKLLLLLASLAGKYPSPGLTQLQLRRAKQTEEWLFEKNAGDPKYAPMREALGRSEGTTDLLFRLYNRDAVKYAAAHIRWLMEEEYGGTVNAGDLSVDQMAIVVAQYNVGPRSEVTVADYSGNVFYRVAPIYIRAWQIRMR